MNKNVLNYLRTHTYTVLLSIVEISWLMHMLTYNLWYLFTLYWPATITMIFGSFVAGFTSEGGAFIAFPVFTKVLGLTSLQASTFGLMIQSIGMTCASAAIYSLRVKVLKRVILWTSIGGAIGMFIGLRFISLPSLYPRLLFTLLVISFGVALYISKWHLKLKHHYTTGNWSNFQRVLFTITGVVGGIISSQVGSGINMLVYMVLSLSFGIYDKISVPTSVIIMAINSVVGFAIHYFSDTISEMWNYWIVAVPVVALGAPLGAYLVHKVTNDFIVGFILLLIILEAITTFLMISFDLYLVVFSCLVTLLFLFLFFWLLRFRMKYEG